MKFMSRIEGGASTKTFVIGFRWNYSGLSEIRKTWNMVSISQPSDLDATDLNEQENG